MFFHNQSPNDTPFLPLLQPLFIETKYSVVKDDFIIEISL